MSRKHPVRNINQQSLLAADLAARFMRESGLPMNRAREKAVTKLGLNPRTGNPHLPTNRQIQQALEIQLSLFSSSQRTQLLDEKRQAALEAMNFLRHFHPRLVGSVLDGSAQMSDPVILQLHPNQPEDVPLFLEDHHLTAHLRSTAILLHDGMLNVSCWHLTVDDTDFHLCVLPTYALHHPPLQLAGDTAPMQRANIDELRCLIAR